MADSRSPVNGAALAAVSVGAVFVYAGIKGRSVLATVQSLIAGTGPAGTAQSSPIDTTSTGLMKLGLGASGDTGISAGAGSTGPGVAGGAAAGQNPQATNPQATLHSVAATFGWGSGTEWQSLSTLEMGEAGFNPKNKNRSSNAYGLAQSLGHKFDGGPAPNGINEYGGYGLTPAQSRAASMGDPYWQSVWMCTYIKSQYGSPSNALREWRAREPHWY